MAGFDRNNVYNVSVHEPLPPTAPDTPSETEKLLLDFLLSYRVRGEFIYRSANASYAFSHSKRPLETNYAPIYY